LDSWDERSIFIVDATIVANFYATYLDSETGAKLTAQLGVYYRIAPEGSSSGVGVRGLCLVRRVDTGKTCGGVPTATRADCSPQVAILARLEAATLP
jgi:hypothetical protein